MSKTKKDPIVAMLKELVEEIDHDIAKSYFDPEYQNSDEGQDPSFLVAIVKKHMSKIQKESK